MSPKKRRRRPPRALPPPPPGAERTTSLDQVGGSIVVAGAGRHETVVDTTHALLLDNVTSCTLETPGRPVVALLFDGRINRRDKRARVLVIADADGLADVVAQLVHQARDSGADFAMRVAEALRGPR